MDISLSNIKFSCKLFLFTHNDHCITTTFKIPIYLYDTISSSLSLHSANKHVIFIYLQETNDALARTNKRVESCHQFLRSHWSLSRATGTHQSPAPPNFFLVATCIIFASAWTSALINADADADADVQINADVPHLRMRMRIFATSLIHGICAAAVHSR